ncbi:MAG: arginine--tRNA ligase [Candidatus Omnitrophica bacterium]|nr:arginine--tRNA ligase [Candidatus Omnitrophota bacterium]
MQRNIQNFLVEILRLALKDLRLDKIPIESIKLDLPTNSRFGDLSTNVALKITKYIKSSPREVALKLVNRIQGYLRESYLKDYIDEIKVEGEGFINFYLKNNFFYAQIKRILIKGSNALGLNIGQKRPVLIEFVSANPTGPLSVAHARQAAVGDSLANILDFCGFRVKREYYLNDEGNQIDILGKSVELRLRQLQGEKIEFPCDYYQGEYIYDIAREIYTKKEGKFSRNFIEKNFSDYALNYILDIIKKELNDFKVKFDYWTSQRKLRETGKINKNLAYLRKKGFLYEVDGAVWFKSTAFGDDKDRVVVKSDGSYTYLAPDIAYHQEKFRRGFKWLINLWGPDHHGYINRLKAAIEALGYPRNSLSIIIVQLATIYRHGRPIQMSTRRGQYITLREVLNEVGLDAARFFFLMRRTSSHLDFDLELAKKQTPENPVYYVQYAHARICSILKNTSLKIRQDTDLSLLKEDEEIALIKKICHFSYILNICLTTLDPYMLTVYLMELAEVFHKFYDRHRVLGEDKKLTQARLSLIEATRITLAKGLELLGVSQPKEM